jgi:hypothetical protein
MYLPSTLPRSGPSRALFPCFVIRELLKHSSAKFGPLVRQWTIPTKRPQVVGKVTANLSGYRVSLDQRKKSPTVVNFGSYKQDSSANTFSYLFSVHGTESFLRSCRSFSYSIFFQHFMEPKDSLGRRRWVDSIKMDLREIGWDGMDWIDLAQDRDQWRALVNTVMNLRVQ